MLFFSLILLLSFELKAQSDSKTELIKLNEGEMKLIEKRGANNSELKHRYLELMSEKIGFIRERENKFYMNLKAEARKERTKDSFFEESKNYYKKTKDYGLELIKNHPRYDRIAEVLYTLAINARDFSKDKEEESFFLDALKRTSQDSPVAHQSHIGLAEFYYNEKKFEEAHKYYRKIIEVESDTWLPKHLYNMAWCELKLRKFSSSIELMKRAFELARDPSYLSNADDVLGHIGMFYIQADRAEEGIDFYLQKNIRPAYYLFKMSRNLAEKGQYELTRKTLNQALELSSDKAQKNNDELHADIRLFQLEFYRNFAQADHFVETAEALSKEKLNEQQRDEAIQKTREYSGYLQIRLTENAKKNIRTYDPEHLKRIINLFNTLKVLDPIKAFQYAYYQGETNFSVRHYPEAISSYEEALTLASKDASQTEEMRKAIASLLSLLDESNLKPEEKTPHYIIAYSEHVRLWPKGDKSRVIYPKLFSLLKAQDTNKAQSIFEQYVQNFPNDQKEQQELCLALMDDSVEKKDINKLAQWTQKLDKGFLSFTSDKVEKAVGVLGHMLFEAIEKKTDKNEAIKEYISLYENHRYPQKIKAKSAFNASSLYLEEGEISKSLEWYKTALSIYPKEDLKDLRPILVTMSLKFALRLDLEGAKNILKLYLEKTSKTEEQDVAIWDHYFLYSLSLDQGKEAIQLLSKNNLLSSKDKNDLTIAIAKKYFSFGDMNKYLASAEGLNETSLKPYTQAAAERLYYANALTIDDLKSEKYGKFTFIQKMAEIEDYKREFKVFEKKRPRIPTRFNETHFNWALEDYLLKLKESVERGQVLLKRMDKENGVRLSKIIPQFYAQAAYTIENLDFQKIPADMRDSFKEVMFKMAQDFKNEENKLKEKLGTVASNNYTFEERNTIYPQKETQTKVTKFALEQIQYPKDCEVLKKDILSEKENWGFWKDISQCYLSQNKIKQAYFYMGISIENASKLSKRPDELLNLQGIMALHQGSWDEAYQNFSEANSKHNLMLFKMIFGQYSEAEEYYSNLDPKDPNYAQAKELFMLLKGMSYAKN